MLKIIDMIANVQTAETATVITPSPVYFDAVNINQPAPKYKMEVLHGWKKTLVRSRIRLHILYLALANYKSLRISIKVFKALYAFKKIVLGGEVTKIVAINNKYYVGLYTPGFPSKEFDRFVEGEFNRVIPLKKNADALSFIFFAITKKCPLNCEHCFEWNNLNKAESFNLGELKAVVDKFQKDGLSQIHLSGGEPMVRVKDLIPLIEHGKDHSEFFVLTSGFNFTASNAKALKQAGLTGVVISLDHFDPQIHDAFRGFKNSYQNVMDAIRNAQGQQLVIALTLCATKAFITWDNLLQYAELAKNLKVPFIQLLEPKAVGHYEGQDIFLNDDHLKLLEQFFLTLNFDPAYKDYPVIIYHGYHQRRVGCLSGGNRNLYIDSEGYVNACPFCHTKNFNIKDALTTSFDIPGKVKERGCQLYEPA